MALLHSYTPYHFYGNYLSKTWPKPPQVGTGAAVGGCYNITSKTGRFDPISEGPEVALNGLWAIDNMGYCLSWPGKRNPPAVVRCQQPSRLFRQLVQLMQLIGARASVRWIWGGRCAPIFSARSTGSGRIGPDPRLCRRARCRLSGIWAPDRPDRTISHGPRSASR